MESSIKRKNALYLHLYSYTLDNYSTSRNWRMLSGRNNMKMQHSPCRTGDFWFSDIQKHEINELQSKKIRLKSKNPSDHSMKFLVA